MSGSRIVIRSHTNGYLPESEMLYSVGEYHNQVLGEVFRFERIPAGADVDDS